MRRLGLVLVMILAFGSFALAEGWMDFEEYAEKLAALTENEWETEGAVRVLELEDDATISVCLDGSEVVAVTVEALMDGALYDYAYAAFEATGLLSEEALAGLTEIVEEGETTVDESIVIYRLIGEARECFAVCLAEQAEDLVWQSVHGGKKWHDIPPCSGMDVSRLVTDSAAEELGYDPCGICAD